MPPPTISAELRRSSARAPCFPSDHILCQALSSVVLHALAGAPESHSPFEPGKAGTVRMVVNARGKGRFQGAGPALDLATCSPRPHPLPLLHLQATMLLLPPACCCPYLVTS